jgi:hypothetical protein
VCVRVCVCVCLCEVRACVRVCGWVGVGGGVCVCVNMRRQLWPIMWPACVHVCLCAFVSYFSSVH